MGGGSNATFQTALQNSLLHGSFALSSALVLGKLLGLDTRRHPRSDRKTPLGCPFQPAVIGGGSFPDHIVMIGPPAHRYVI